MFSEFIEAAVSITESTVDVKLRSEGGAIQLQLQDPLVKYPLQKVTACNHDRGLTQATFAFFERVCSNGRSFKTTFYHCFLSFANCKLQSCLFCKC